MSLVAWYPLIDGSLENKGLDITPLTLHGTVPFTNGRVRTAPTFSANASNYYTMPPITKVNDFSTCCWVKCSSTVNGWIFYQGVVNSNNNRLGFVDASGAEGKLKYIYGNIVHTVPYTSSTWVHMCMTIDENGLVHIYLNGENINNSSTNAGYEYAEGHDLHIGKAETVQPWKSGQLQDFRYYDHCLSPKEVKEIAKGLCLHLPLKGTNARPNLFKNSATMFNGIGGLPVSTTCTSSPTLVFDENAPCGANGKILRATVNRPDNTVSDTGGYFYNPTRAGIPTLTIGQKYCVSIWARCTANNVNFWLEVFMEDHTPVKGSANRTLTSEWKRYYAIFTATKTGSTICFYIKAPIGASGTLEYCCPKLELLSPTPYIPNVDDTQYSNYVLDYEPDCSGNEFDATKYGGLTTSDSNGRYNTAVAFNGTNTYLQGLAPTNSECKEFTIATWVKLNNVSANHTLYACRTATGRGIALFYIGAGGIRFDDGIDNAIFSNSRLEPDKWYHIAVTRDTNTRKLYINGEFVSSGATTGALANMANMYQVGESNAQTTSPKGNYLNGSLSDFRLYTSVLSADDVKELYETSVSIAHNTPSLTESAYYNYVEGQKHSTFDKSKFTVVGSPTITDDGVASGFSGTNYLTIPTIDLSQADSFELILPYITPSKLSNGQQYIYLGASFNMSVNLTGYLYYFNLVFEDDTNSVLYDTTSIAKEPNSLYLIKLTFNIKEGYKAYYKLPNSNEWVLHRTNTTTKRLKASAFINKIGQIYSSGAYGWTGSVPLPSFSITVDGKEVFSGNKTGLDVIKPDNYTVVGTPTISEDGVVSGFSTSNYLQQINLPDLSLANTWKIAGKFTQTTSLPTNYKRLFAYAGAINVVPSCLVQIYENKLNFAAYSAETGDTIFNSSSGRYNIELDKDYWFELEFTGNKYIGRVSTDGVNYITFVDFSSSTKVISRMGGCIFGAGFQSAFDIGSIDLNAFKIYVDGNLVYQPCLKIPYTESKTGIKVVDSTYLDRVKDVYDQHYLERYYTADETTQTVYEYPLFRDSMHSYEFDEGIQASITKNGIHNATTLTEATKTSMYQNNTDTVTLIEN